VPANERIAELEKAGLRQPIRDRLTLANPELTAKLSDADLRNRKLLRNSRRDESPFKDQLAVAQRPC
jgi:hypothetical protein